MFGKKIRDKKNRDHSIVLNALLYLPGHKVTLPPSNKGEQEIFRDVKGCNWIQNGIKLIIQMFQLYLKKNFLYFL